jgi:hypothetical protein
MNLYHRGLAMFAVLLGLSICPARADVTITITQQGSNVVATGSGTIDTTDLQFEKGDSVSSGVNPGIGLLQLGPASSTGMTYYTGLSGPSSFGSTTMYEFASSGTGDAFGPGGSTIELPQFYTSGASLSSTITWTNETITGLTLTPGTYTWIWGTGADADSLTLQIGPTAVVPEPSTALVAVFGALAFIAYGWSHHRSEQRRQAAA